MSGIIPALTAAARQVGESLLAAPQPPRVASMSEFRQVFSEIDDRVSGILGERLAAIRPGVPAVDDMRGQIPRSGEAWVVDAVDGAVQYMRGLPQWCVSIALVRDGQPAAAVLHSPVLGETYTAQAGQGAALNGEPLCPSATAGLQIALVATSHPPFAAAQPGAAAAAGAALAAVMPRVGAVRNLGPTSWQVADVAGGRIDAFWMFGRDPGNLLAASLIAREAGLAVTDAEGCDWTPGSDSFLTASPALHGPLAAVLASSGHAGIVTPACLSVLCRSAGSDS